MVEEILGIGRELIGLLKGMPAMQAITIGLPILFFSVAFIGIWVIWKRWLEESKENRAALAAINEKHDIRMEIVVKEVAGAMKETAASNLKIAESLTSIGLHVESGNRIIELLNTNLTQALINRAV